MPKIEIITPGTDQAEPAPTQGTILKVDGREVDKVTDIDVKIGVNDVVRVQIGVMATEQLHFESGAELHVDVTAPPGYQVLATPLPNGGFRYIAERLNDE